MKILQLRFKNLNSLYGEWQIDFTDPHYLANGIFALTGPTGAGKSTILDAICLALYGSTPRLGKITRNNNDIMSRQSGECYAEVCFESSEGRFRCHWSQHRARKKPDGKLAESKHEISDADSGEILESKKRDVALVIEAKTGMDFERFTRSILLAQGGFDTFLKADIEQKSKILEQITGTDIYSRISQQSHEKLKTEREQLAILRAEIAGIKLLSEEEEQAIEDTLQTREQQQHKLSEQLEKTQNLLNGLKRIDALHQEIKKLEVESGQLKTEQQAFIPQRNKLDLAIKASHLDGLYATINALRKQRARDQQQLQTEQKRLPELETEVKRHQARLTQSEQHLSTAKESLQSSMPVFKQVRAMDQDLLARQQQLEKLQSDYQHILEQIQAEENRVEQLQKQSAQTTSERQKIDDYLQKHARDQWLVSGLAGIEAQLTTLTSIQKNRQASIENINQNLGLQEQQQHKLLETKKGFDACQGELKNIQALLEQKQQLLKQRLKTRLLREYRAEKEALLRELSLLRTIADLEQQRKQLQDNQPCPLCGSLEHPYAEGNVPAVDETEKKLQQLDRLITEAEQIEADIRQLEQDEQVVRKKRSDSEQRKQADEYELRTIEQNLSQSREALSHQEQELNELKNTVLKHLNPLGIKTLDHADFSELLKQLRQRLQHWHDYQQKFSDLERQLAYYNADINTRNALIQTHKKNAREKQEQQDKETQVLEKITQERDKLFGNKDPDKEESRLRQAVSDAENSEKKSREQFNRVQQVLNSLQVNLQSLQQRIDQCTTDLKNQEEEFIRQLPRQGFADEAEFVQATLSPQERQQLHQKAQALDNKQLSVNTRLKESRKKLRQEENSVLRKKITPEQRGLLEQEQKDLTQALSEISEQLAALKYQLQQNRINSDRIKQQQSAIDLQHKECQRWEKLHALIGSADGKKYRNFAQGLTFELMVAHANRQLKNMTDRYLLIRDKYQPLELNVIDNYQGGEIRSVRNLSGGESFIVSLNLALGLSKMASRKVRVDSLFLDEGFGSLDEEALESALEALAGLHQDGKLIGIISHVSALKERISTRIQVKPQAGGKSIIEGPGCASINLK